MELDLVAIVLATDRLEVELGDEHAEHKVVDDELGDADGDVDGPVRLADAQREVIEQKVDEAVRSDRTAAEHVEGDHAEAGETGVHHEQDRRDEQERELDRLGDACDERAEGGGDEDGLDLALVLGLGGVVHGKAGADQAEHLGEAAGVPHHGCGEDLGRGVGDLRVVDVASALVDLAGDLGGAAELGVEERRVHEVV